MDDVYQEINRLDERRLYNDLSYTYNMKIEQLLVSDQEKGVTLTPKHPAKITLLQLPPQEGVAVPIIQFDNPLKSCSGSGKQARVAENVGFCANFKECGFMYNIYIIQK